MRPATESIAVYLGGFVAAEGTFFSTGTPPKFVFAVGLGASDRVSCELLRDFFGVGNLTESPRRKAHYDDEVTFAIQSMRDHLAVTIPFMDAHLPDSYKRQQYVAWRDALLEYWEHSAKRRRPCTIAGCDAPRRAHGVCRHHLWLLHGQLPLTSSSLEVVPCAAVGSPRANGAPDGHTERERAHRRGRRRVARRRRRHR